MNKLNWDHIPYYGGFFFFLPHIHTITIPWLLHSESRLGWAEKEGDRLPYLLVEVMHLVRMGSWGIDRIPWDNASFLHRDECRLASHLWSCTPPQRPSLCREECEMNIRTSMQACIRMSYAFISSIHSIGLKRSLTQFAGVYVSWYLTVFLHSSFFNS